MERVVSFFFHRELNQRTVFCIYRLSLLEDGEIVRHQSKGSRPAFVCDCGRFTRFRVEKRSTEMCQLLLFCILNRFSPPLFF